MQGTEHHGVLLLRLLQPRRSLSNPHEAPPPPPPPPPPRHHLSSSSSSSSSSASNPLLSPRPIPSLSFLPHESPSSSAIAESLIAELFAIVSAIKASYAELQLAQNPFDPASIHSADLAIVAELRRASDLKYSYLADPDPTQPQPQPNPNPSPVLSLLREQRNLLRTYEVTSKQLESDLDSLDSRLRALRSDLSDLAHANRALESRLRGQPRSLAGLHLSGLDPTHLLAALRGAVSAVKSFVRLMARRMERAAPPWDLDAAARSAHPAAAAALRHPRHRSFAFVSYVCHRMFSDFHHRDFNLKPLAERRAWDRRRFFREFSHVRSATARQVLDGGLVGSPGFDQFRRAKYASVVGPKMEAALFSSSSAAAAAAAEDRRRRSGRWGSRRWRLGFGHCIASSTRSGRRWGPRYSRCGGVAVLARVHGERGEGSWARWSWNWWPGGGPATVAFTVVPGFRVGKTIIQCRVYLESCEGERTVVIS
uniref:Uncharacterized protein n=1 Tax=Ananas comosus var. bracteatus TaxID=296719 RepID=A0A6V7P056_ANACO|nr:unnamed protein product [Ananas comosus var. bracteatus]